VHRHYPVVLLTVVCNSSNNIQKTWATLSSFDAISAGLGNIIIILMQPWYCSDATQQSFRPRCKRGPSSRRQLAPFFERISYGLGRHYHYFDEISILFETTRQYFRPRNVVLAIAEFSRTITRFHQIMITLSKPCGHFRQLVKTVNHEFKLKLFINV
jgi:hypothetical protein